MKIVRFTSQQLLDAKNQKKIFELLRTKEHQVDELRRKINQRGFDLSHPLIVQKVPKSNRFLVLEGNRRLTAIRLLLTDKKTKSTRKTELGTIPCLLFTVDNIKDERFARAQLVVDQHLDKKKDHTRIQSAHMLHDVYMARLPKSKGAEKFYIDLDVIRYFTRTYGYSEKEFELELAVVQLYTQIADAGISLDHKYRERLTWPHLNSRQFRKYFGYDVNSFRLDKPGLERYVDLFISPSAPVHNPKLFRSFLNVMRYGTPRDVESIRISGDQGYLEEVAEQVVDTKKAGRFVADLQKVEKLLSKLKASEFSESEEELRLIRRIEGLVERVAGLVPEDIELTQELNPTRPKKSPSTIDQATKLSDDNVAWAVLRIFKTRRRGRIDRGQITTLLLQRWGILSRGLPRQKFEAIVERVVDRLVNNNLLRF